MEKDNSDSDFTSEWLFLSWEDKPEDKKEECFTVTSSIAFTSMDMRAFNSCRPEQNHSETDVNENKTEGSVKDGFGYLDEESSSISPDVNNAHVLEDESSRDSSDIDVLGTEEDELVEKMASANSHLSIFDLLTSSESSKFSLPKVVERKKETNEGLPDTSSVSQISKGLSSNVDLGPFFTPKTQLYFALSMMVVFAMTVGLGVYFGWFCQWVQCSQVTLDQVEELKQMQNELLQCLGEENKELSTLGIERTFCQECCHDPLYWKEKFQVFFYDEKDEESILKKTQKIQCNEIEVPLSSPEIYKEFNKLKLNIFLKEMENIQLFKNYKEVKQEEQSQQLLDALKAENNELKNKLEQEKKDDIFVDSKISAVNNENCELKTKLEENRKKAKIFEQCLITLCKENMKLKTGLLRKQDTDLRKENNKLKDMLLWEGSNFVNNSKYDTNITNKVPNIDHFSDKEKYVSKDNMKHVTNVEDRDYGKILIELEQNVELLKRVTVEIKLKLAQQVSDKQVLINLEKNVKKLKGENENIKMFLNYAITEEMKNSQDPGFSTLKYQLQSVMAENDLLKLKVNELEFKKLPEKQGNKENTKQEKLPFDLSQKHELKDQMIHGWKKIKVCGSEQFNNKFCHKLLKQDNDNIESFVAVENPDKTLLIQLLTTKPVKAQKLINMYDDLKKGKSDHCINGSISFLEYNWIDMFQDILQDSSEVFFHMLKLMFSDIMNKIAGLSDDTSSGSGKILTNFLKNIGNKLEEFHSITQSAEFKLYAYRNPKLVTEYSGGFHKIHDVCIQFLKKQTKLVDNMLQTFDILKKKWRHLYKKWKKIKDKIHDKNKELYKNTKKVTRNYVKIDKFQCPSSSFTENEIKVEKNEVFDKVETVLNYPSSDWFFIRANDREQQHIIYPSQLFDDWHVRRARGRQYQRNLAIFNQFEENWFLKRNKGRRSSGTNLYHYEVPDS
ncbi:uncharacterized protein LOC143258484 isoform X2 [Tachypleus tridentatus]|uniref:uncharacterized protein LOC143258484 isoform X2 n=1 Tax=Tachypleus tridentatus TaxID=6853 RepID=UPI003FD1ED65